MVGGLVQNMPCLLLYAQGQYLCCQRFRIHPPIGEALPRIYPNTSQGKKQQRLLKSDVSGGSCAYSEEQIQMEFSGVKTKGSERIQLGRNIGYYRVGGLYIKIMAGR